MTKCDAMATQPKTKGDSQRSDIRSDVQNAGWLLTGRTALTFADTLGLAIVTKAIYSRDILLGSMGAVILAGGTYLSSNLNGRMNAVLASKKGTFSKGSADVADFLVSWMNVLPLPMAIGAMAMVRAAEPDGDRPWIYIGGCTVIVCGILYSGATLGMKRLLRRELSREAARTQDEGSAKL